MTKEKSTIKDDEKRTLDWDAVHQRLKANNELFESGWAPDAETTRQILKERACKLAKEPRSADKKKDDIIVVEFLLANEKYAFELSFIREIYPIKNLTHIPCTPNFVVGIINVRGQMISVIDLKPLFELDIHKQNHAHKAILLHHDTMDFGILADEIIGTQQINISEIQESLPTLNGVREAYLKGITTSGIAVLDAQRLLSDDRILVHENH